MRAALIVLVLHGGGWDSGHPSSMDPTVKALNARGIVAKSIPYTLGDLPAAVQDVSDAVRICRHYYRHVALYGFSAGGTIAALLAARGEVDRAVIESSPSDLLTWRSIDPRYGNAAHYARVGVGSKALRARYSPARAASRPAPMLALYGEADRLVPLEQGRRLAKATGARLIVKRNGLHQVDVRYRTSAFKFLAAAADR